MRSTSYILIFVLFSFSILTHVTGGVIRVLPAPKQGNVSLFVRRFARIPHFNNSASKIVGITEWHGSLFVCTSVSGGLIYRVSPRGQVSLWFNVNHAMLRNGRKLDVSNRYHGGVRSIAFHPKFGKNRLIYISALETRTKPLSAYKYLSHPKAPIKADSIILEFRVSKKTNRPIISSLREVLRIGLQHYDHPIKQVVFWRNLLYIGHGDGSVQSAFVGGGQNKQDALGKILRINPEQGRNGQRYSIPKLNPFIHNRQFRPEIFALGFRNPHNLCFSRRKGDLFVADAGRDNVEEINIVKKGGNYGWAEREGPFVHFKKVGGLKSGIGKLPRNDARNNFIYPNIALGHVGEPGWTFEQAGQAIASSCPIENGSALSGLILFCNFPTTGDMYYSHLMHVRQAVVKGNPNQLRSAKIYKPNLYFDHDDNPKTPPRKVRNFRDIVRLNNAPKMNKQRADLRFGRGRFGEIYVSSKQNGVIYLIRNSLPVS